MYSLPGYTKYEEINRILKIRSELFQNEIEVSEEKLKKDFYSIVENRGVDRIENNFHKILSEQGMLQTEEEIVECLENTKQLLNEDLLLTILPTENCNFRCPYCYEKHNPQILSSKHIQSIKNYILSQISTTQNLHISWFGGEPTLCKNIIFDITNFVLELKNKYNFYYDSNMTTNGYLLDRDTFLSFYNIGINAYQITLDGWNHDVTRPHVSGVGTKDRILENLKNISQLSSSIYKFKITIRHNILKNDNDFDWYDYLKKEFGDDDRFVVAAVPVSNWGGDTIKELNIVDSKEERKKLQQTHDNYLDKIGLKRDGMEKQPFSDICYSSCKRGLIFCANGDIEKCSIALHNPKNIVGKITDDGILLDEKKLELWSCSSLQKKCLRCKDVLSCLNICCRKKVVIDDCPEDICLCENNECIEKNKTKA